MPATIKQVAKLAGVSKSTVSHVLNGTHYVSPELTARVLEAVDNLDYELNPVARMLAGGRSHLIGVIIPDLLSSFCAEVIRGVDVELFDRQYEMILYTSRYIDRHDQRPARSYASTFASGLVGGLLIILPFQTGTYLKTLQRKNIPCVMVEHQGSESACPVIESTNWQGAFDATEYLIQLGHRRIAFISGRTDLRSSHDRLAGYEAALAHYGIPFESALVVTGSFEAGQTRQVTHALLELTDAPTAIFASSDMMAFSVLEVALQRGLRIPDNLSVIGFDDIPQSATSHPPLTTVQQSLIEMGRVAARMLIARIENPALPIEHVQLKTQLIIRQSTQSPPLSIT
jgi:LacI family transcriptional regulator